MSLVIYVAILIFVVLGVLWGFSFYLVKTKRLDIKEWFRNSLGLPRGSVRAIIAIAFISALICASLKKIEIPDLPDWAVGITGTVIGFYFGAAINRPDTKGETTTSTGTQQPP
jgi:drug/metabolite transporter (DMT)-like permease